MPRRCRPFRPPPPPEYAFCESPWAGSRPNWHIRRLTMQGRMPGGGADTLALCGATVAWDLGRPVTPDTLFQGDCVACIEIFRAEVGMSGLDADDVRAVFARPPPAEDHAQPA